MKGSDSSSPSSAILCWKTAAELAIGRKGTVKALDDVAAIWLDPWPNKVDNAVEELPVVSSNDAVEAEEAAEAYDVVATSKTTNCGCCWGGL